MFFHTCDHYEHSLHNFDFQFQQQIRECFICYDLIDEPNSSQLASQKIYRTPCKCIGSIHSKCLSSWVRLQKKCPICRTTVIQQPTPSIKNYWIVYFNLLKIIIQFFPLIVFCCTCYRIFT
jgi:E3 ubiquitin-protein ligase DOA10